MYFLQMIMDLDLVLEATSTPCHVRVPPCPLNRICTVLYAKLTCTMHTKSCVTANNIQKCILFQHTGFH